MKNKTSQYWIVEGLDSTELMYANLCDHEYKKHSHQEFAIGVVISGIGIITCREKTWYAPPGSITILNPRQGHKGKADPEKGLEYFSFYIPETLMKECSTDVGLPHFPSQVINNDHFFRRFLNLFTLLIPNRSLQKETLFYELLSDFIAGYASTASENKAIANNHAMELVKDFIHVNYSQNIGLRQLAELAGCSKAHLLRNFRQQFGLPPYAYLLNRRIEKAKTFLGAGLPASEVALKTGFSDQSHFTNTFKKITATTPFRYQQAFG